MCIRLQSVNFIPGILIISLFNNKEPLWAFPILIAPPFLMSMRRTFNLGLSSHTSHFRRRPFNSKLVMSTKDARRFNSFDYDCMTS